MARFLRGGGVYLRTRDTDRSGTEGATDRPVGRREDPGGELYAADRDCDDLADPVSAEEADAQTGVGAKRRLRGGLSQATLRGSLGIAVRGRAASFYPLEDRKDAADSAQSGEDDDAPFECRRVHDMQNGAAIKDR